MSQISVIKQLTENPDWINRHALSSLYLAQLFILLPHLFYVPLWVAGIWVLCAIWRWQIYSGVWGFPNFFTKALLVGAASVALLIQVGAGFSFQTMISLLVIGFSLKLIEMKSTHDFLWVIFIGLFIVATQFIEYSEFYSALFAAFLFVVDLYIAFAIRSGEAILF